jgi:acyl-coenzyme A synthetase/AMP-(fatty) acid ligase
MHEWVTWHARRRPDAPAITTRVSRLSYQDLHGRIGAFAARLFALGMTPGDRILVALPNVPASVVVALGANAAGVTSVEVSRVWSTDMLADVLRRSHVRHVAISARDARSWTSLLASAAIERVWLVGTETAASSVASDLGHPVSWLAEDGTLSDLERPEPDPTGIGMRASDVALILFTSGSTGRPSGVIQTVGNIHANTRSIVEYLHLTAADRAFLTLPLAYCYGRSVLQTHLYAGGSVYLENGFAFPRVAMETLASEGCTSFAGVPLTFEILRRQVDLSDVQLDSLRYVTQAGGQMAPETTAWLRAAVSPARVYVMYGQTEATARLSYLPPERAEDKSGSIGIPIPGVAIRIVDEAGREVADGTVGEIEAMGDNVTTGYLDDPEATAGILRDGWLRTGDLGYRDQDGFLFHRGRAKEIMKIGGHRVSPLEIEHILATHPDIAEAAVRGTVDELMGEVPVAFVVLRAGRAIDDGALRAWFRERLPPWMVPVRFVQVPRLPRNEAGKLLRTQLTESG